MDSVIEINKVALLISAIGVSDQDMQIYSPRIPDVPSDNLFCAEPNGSTSMTECAG